MSRPTKVSSPFFELLASRSEATLFKLKPA